MLWLAGYVSGIALHGGVSEHVHRVRDKACLKKRGRSKREALSSLSGGVGTTC